VCLGLLDAVNGGDRFSLRIGGCPVPFVSDADLSSVRCRLRISRHNSDHDEKEWVTVGLQEWTELLRLRLKLKRWHTTNGRNGVRSIAN